MTCTPGPTAATAGCTEPQAGTSGRHSRRASVRRCHRRSRPGGSRVGGAQGAGVAVLIQQPSPPALGGPRWWPRRLAAAPLQPLTSASQCWKKVQLAWPRARHRAEQALGGVGGQRRCRRARPPLQGVVWYENSLRRGRAHGGAGAAGRLGAAVDLRFLDELGRALWSEQQQQHNRHAPAVSQWAAPAEPGGAREWGEGRRHRRRRRADGRRQAKAGCHAAGHPGVLHRALTRTLAAGHRLLASPGRGAAPLVEGAAGSS